MPLSALFDKVNLVNGLLGDALRRTGSFLLIQRKVFVCDQLAEPVRDLHTLGVTSASQTAARTQSTDITSVSYMCRF
jgi:hypothetical protein